MKKKGKTLDAIYENMLGLIVIGAVAAALNVKQPETVKQKYEPYLTEPLKTEYIVGKKYTLEDKIDDKALLEEIGPLSYLIDTDEIISKTKRFEQSIEKASDNYDSIDNYIIKALIWVESRANPYAKSKKGARGLMQLMPLTAKELNLPRYLIADPDHSIDKGTKYLDQLMEKYHQNEVLALAAYNWGACNVDDLLNREKTRAWNTNWKRIKYKLPRQTRKYIPKVLGTALALEKRNTIKKIYTYNWQEDYSKN